MSEPRDEEGDKKGALVRSRSEGSTLQRSKSKKSVHNKKLDKSSHHKGDKGKDDAEKDGKKKKVKSRSKENIFEKSDSTGETTPATIDESASINSEGSLTLDQAVSSAPSQVPSTVSTSDSVDNAGLDDTAQPADGAGDGVRRSLERPKKKKSDMDKSSHKIGRNKSSELSKSMHKGKSKSDMDKSALEGKGKSDMDKSTHKGKGKSDMDKSTHKGKAKSDMDKSTHRGKVKSDMDKSTHKGKVKSDMDKSTHKGKMKSDMDKSTHKGKVKSDMDKSTHRGKDKSDMDKSTHKGKAKSDMDKSTHKGKSKSDMDKSSHKGKSKSDMDKSSHKASKAEKKKDNALDMSTHSTILEENEYEWGDASMESLDTADAASTDEPHSKSKKRGRKADLLKASSERIKDGDIDDTKRSSRSSHSKSSDQDSASVDIDSMADDAETKDSLDSNDATLELFAPISADGPVIPAAAPEPESQDKPDMRRRGPGGALLTRQASKNFGRILKREASQDDIFAALELEAEEMEKVTTEVPLSSSHHKDEKGKGKSSDMDKSSHRGKKKSSDMDKSSHRGKKKDDMDKSSHRRKKSDMDKSSHRGMKKSDLDKSKHRGKLSTTKEEEDDKPKVRRVVRARDMVRKDSTDSDSDSSSSSSSSSSSGKKSVSRRAKAPVRSQSMPIRKWEPGQQIKPMAASELREMLKLKGPTSKPVPWRDSVAFRDDFKPSVPSVFQAYPVPANNDLGSTADNDSARSSAIRDKYRESRDRKAEVKDALTEYLMGSVGDFNFDDFKAAVK